MAMEVMERQPSGVCELIFLRTLLVFFSLIAFSPLGESALAADCSRLVSLAPSTTELVTELSLDSHLSGISRYCPQPNNAPRAIRIGGFLDLNLELLIQLQPSLVLTLAEHRDQRRAIEQLGITTVSLEHRNVSGILESIDTIGRLCDRTDSAQKLRLAIESRMRIIQEQAKNRPRKRVLVVIGGGARDDSIGSMWVSGSDGFYSDLLALLGAENVYKGQSISAPTISAEGILSIHPDTILEIVPDRELAPEEAQRIKARWKDTPLFSGLEDLKVVVMSGPKVATPGPHFIDVLEQMSKLLHDETTVVTHVSADS